MNGWRDEPAEDWDARRAILWRALKPRTVPVRRPTTELAREALDLYTGPAESLIVKDFRNLARRPDWRPSPNQAAVILSIVARTGLRALDGEATRR